MIPEIIKRRIGRVTLVDVRGALVGASALRKREDLARALYMERAEPIVLNLTDLTGLDWLGAKCIVESAKRLPDLSRVGVLGGTQAMREIMNQFGEGAPLRLFRDQADMIDLLGIDFAGFDEPRTDRRKSVRLKTALPIQFDAQREGRRMEFQAIAVNLSEQGLFAECLDLETAARSLEYLNPYDGKQLHLLISLTKGKRVEAEGRVIHRKLDGEQVGIGIQFVNLGVQERELIRRFLNGS